MDADSLARISPDHRRRLAWFEDHKGEVTGMPAPLEDGLLLTSKRPLVAVGCCPTTRKEPARPIVTGSRQTVA
jgi:hypothetical protein